MNDYVINKLTYMVIPINDYQSKIIEKYNNYIIDKKVFDIINDSCLFYGSSFKGRACSSSALLGIKCKCPIVISEKSEIVMFPTSSALKKDCVWINNDAILNYNYKNKLLELELINHLSFKLKISAIIFNNQYFRASRLKGILKSKNR